MMQTNNLFKDLPWRFICLIYPSGYKYFIDEISSLPDEEKQEVLGFVKYHFLQFKEILIDRASDIAPAPRTSREYPPC